MTRTCHLKSSTFKYFQQSMFMSKTKKWYQHLFVNKTIPALYGFPFPHPYTLTSVPIAPLLSLDARSLQCTMGRSLSLLSRPHYCPRSLCHPLTVFSLFLSKSSTFWEHFSLWMGDVITVLCEDGAISSCLVSISVHPSGAPELLLSLIIFTKIILQRNTFLSPRTYKSDCVLEAYLIYNWLAAESRAFITLGSITQTPKYLCENVKDRHALFQFCPWDLLKCGIFVSLFFLF